GRAARPCRHGEWGGAVCLWPACTRPGDRVVAAETRQSVLRDGRDLLRAAEPARGAGARHLAYRAALPAMDDAARDGGDRRRTAARRRRFRRPADAAAGVGRLTRTVQPGRKPGPL